MFMRGPKANADSGDRSVWGNFWFSPVPGARLTTPDSALALTPVYACVKVLAESFACLDFKLYKPNAAGTKRTRVAKHWAVRLFTKAPNRFQTPIEFQMMLMGHLALRGNAFCQIESNSRGEITELLPLHPDRMTVETLANGEYRYRYTDQQGQTIYYARGELWHLRGLSSDGIVGISPVQAARAAIAEGLSMQAYANRFYENDAKPGGGWIEMPRKFANSADKQQFRDDWQSMQGGANRGRVAVLEDGMKFHELGLSNSDSQFVEARAAKVTDVARIFRVPPHKIGDLSRATFSNIEQQSIEFWNDTMLPWARVWKSSIEFFLLGEELGLDVEFDVRPMQRGDAQARATAYGLGIQWGWLTRNEARAMEGLDPIAGLDEPIVPLNMTPAAKLGEDPEPAPDDDAPPADPVKGKPSSGKGTNTATDWEQRAATAIIGNAQRMARRIAAGKAPDAATLAESLAIEPGAATAWLSQNAGREWYDTATIEGSLLELAFPDESNP